ncbi:hypothetical protein [Sporosalibacterium faouarense]|uniref:hypothetical protein n=1 Tax=Sporosalibacterium faouarense TaxID=516123 RepID=UPI00141C4DDF|nr:hypothetical protein [Sporosalibacterium faouarense]MTI49802.1 hypothetical protein [Bacillota bacterium]
MVWLIFAFIVYSAMFLLVPLKKIKRTWFCGLISLIILLIIDNTFINLGAFEYINMKWIIWHIPLFYWLSGFPAGIILFHFYPKKVFWQLPYIVFMTLIFLAIEFLMIWLGYFEHINWSGINSFVLNICGFIITIWNTQWIMNQLKK